MNDNKKMPVMVLDPSQLDFNLYKRQCAGCLILTSDEKILLQQRDQDAHTFPGYLGTFGGGLEDNETAKAAIIRELNEELGAIVDPKDLISLGIISEKITGHTEIVYEYFWHDKNNSILGCYEGQAAYYDNAN